MKHTLPYLALLCLFFSTKTFSQGDPNIIVIIADDMGWTQVSTGLTNLNNPSDFYETPVIERLASEGIAFPHAYVNGANCAPTRAALLSGQYPGRAHNNVFAVDNLNRGGNSTLLVGPDNGLSGSGLDQIPESAITLAETLKNSTSYVTAHFGKFHVGENHYDELDAEKALLGSTTNAVKDQGFDYNYGGGTNGNPGTYFANNTEDPDGDWRFHFRIGPELDVYAEPYTAAEDSLAVKDEFDVPYASLTGTNKHVTDATAAAAIDFMQAEKGNPFFMHFSNYAIHGPFTEVNARPDLLAKYQSKAVGAMHDEVGQAAIAEGMDQAIGNIIHYLEVTPDPRWPGHNLDENTLVYFISDNGSAVVPNDPEPLRAMKGEYYEGGIRSVTFAWTGGDLLANKGTVNTTPIIAFDLYPTIVEAAGGSLPVGYDIDGVSQWQMLTNGTAMTRETLFWHFPGYLIDSKRDSRPVSVIRKGDYKLIHKYETGENEMYNLITDVKEENNLLPSTDQATVDLANELIADLIDYLVEIDAPMPTYRTGGAEVALPVPVMLEDLDNCEAVSGYEASWNFNSSNTIITDDKSGIYNAVATLSTGAVTAATGAGNFIEGDQAGQFDGTTKVQYNNDPFLKATRSNRSISVWLKPDDLVGVKNIFDEGSTLKGITLRLNGSKLQGAVTTNDLTEDADGITTVEGDFPSDGEWHHVAFVFDGGTSLTLYVDGAVEATVATGITKKKDAGNAGGVGGVFGTDCFGANSASEHNYYKGKMDALAIYTVALSESDIDQMNPLWYEDTDVDGYGDSSSFILQCAQPVGYVRNDSDCNDGNPSINPNAVELVGNAIDEDCDGTAQNVLEVDTYETTEFIVAPNPFQNELRVQLPSTFKNDEVQLVLYDINGRAIIQKFVKPIDGHIRISDRLDALSKGIYFLRIYSKQKDNVTIKKLVKL